MSVRDEIMKEKFKQKKIFDAEILSLQKKIEDDEKHLNILNKELEMEKNGYIKNNDQSMIDDAIELINDINEELYQNPLNQKGVKKPVDQVIDDS